MIGIGPKLKERRALMKWSTTKVATLAGISQSFLWRLENGKATGSWETYNKLAGVLGISVHSLFPGESNVEDAALGWRRIPVLDYVQAGRWRGVDSALGDGEMRDTIMTDLEHPPSTFAMRIRGNSMTPDFHEGDVVVIDPTIQPKPGDYVVATDGSGEATFKQYRNAGRNERGEDVFELIPLNTLYGPMRSDREPIAIVGVMVEHRQYRRR